MSLFKKIVKYANPITGPLAFAKDGWKKLSGYEQMKEMQRLADEQNRIQQQQLENAQRQAYEQAGNQLQVNQAGTEETLNKLLKKRTALQQSIRTGGQQRLGD